MKRLPLRAKELPNSGGGIMINSSGYMLQDLRQTESEVYIVLDVSDVGLTDDQFFRLCRDNDDLHIEMSAEGELIIMSPNIPKTGHKHARILQRLAKWEGGEGNGKGSGVVC